MRIRHIFLMFSFIFGFISHVFANEKVITFGQSAVLKGPAQALGIGMNDGILAAFQEVNNQGGILGGYKLQLVSKDDGYEPGRAIENVTDFSQDDSIFAIIGEVGTPTSKAAQPVATRFGKLFIGPFTGAEFLRTPFNKKIINLRPSYYQETEAWTAHAVDKLGYKRIAILYQDDSFGRAGLKGVEMALHKRGLKLVSEGTYTRNTTAIKSAVLSIRRGKPDAIFMVGAYKPCAEFIKLSKKLGVQGPFFNISFVGSVALAKELGDKNDNVIISQVMPITTDKTLSIVTDYNRALKQYKPTATPGFVSLEGYVLGRFLIDVLKNIKGDVTPENFEKTLYSKGQFNVGGLQLTFKEGDNQGMGQKDIRLTRILPNQKFEYVT